MEKEIVSLEQIEEKEPMHPLWLFVKIAKFLGIEKVEINTNYDSLVYCFEIFKTEATQEFCDALAVIRTISGENGSVKCHSAMMKIFYICSKKKNECLCMKSYEKDYLYHDGKNQFHIPDSSIFNSTDRDKPDMEIHVYDKGVAWNYTRKWGGKSKGFPCSMKDFFYYQDQRNTQYEVFYALFLAWGEIYPIWKDLAEDFKNGCAYSSIPLDLIFSCHNRRELLQERIGELEDVIDELERKDWNDFLSVAYDELDEELQKIIDEEQEKRLGADYEEFYGEILEREDELASCWQEQVEDTVVSFIDDTLGMLSY